MHQKEVLVLAEEKGAHPTAAGWSADKRKWSLARWNGEGAATAGAIAIKVTGATKPQ